MLFKTTHSRWATLRIHAKQCEEKQWFNRKTAKNMNRPLEKRNFKLSSALLYTMYKINKNELKITFQ